MIVRKMVDLSTVPIIVSNSPIDKAQLCSKSVRSTSLRMAVGLMSLCSNMCSSVFMRGCIGCVVQGFELSQSSGWRFLGLLGDELELHKPFSS